MHLLDTDTLSYFFKRQWSVAAHLHRVQGNQIALAGFASGRQERQIGRMGKALAGIGERAHRPVDQLIARTALANALTPITRNTREFSRVRGLNLENWFDTAALPLS
jgi:tRNA(fMet)-specific endonuclease VapC